MSTTVTILQGLPGSGKSTFIERDRAEKPDVRAVVVSADHYFEDLARVRGSSYVEVFDPALLGEAHGRCLRSFVAALVVQRLAGPEPREVYVDNTNLRVEEVAPYLALAQAYGCDVRIVRMVGRTPAECAARCTHGVPLRAVEAMAGVLRKWNPPPRWPRAVEVQA